MKKYLLISVASLVALPALNSCGPTGDPDKDAEAFDELLEKYCELDLEIKKKDVDYLEYYAKKKDYKTYLEYDSLRTSLSNDYKDYQQQIEDLNYKIRMIENELNVNDNSYKDYDNDDE